MMNETLANVEAAAAIEAGISIFTIWGVKLIVALLILIAAWVIGRWLDSSVQGIRRMDKTLTSFLGGFAKYSLLVIAIVMILGQFGVQTASLLAVLGAAGLAIGLALQGTLSNVAAGVMLLILRPFNVGDFIKAGNISGVVKTLGLFGTELATMDNLYIFAPNSSIWNTDIINYSRNRHRRMDIAVGITYDSDIDLAFKTIHETLSQDERVVREPEKEPQVMVDAMGDSSVNLIVRLWALTNDFWQVKWDVTKRVKESLDRAGINIAFPTRTVQVIDFTDNPDDNKDAKKKAAVKAAAS
jgi:small conductance mechanosensitive channel